MSEKNKPASSWSRQWLNIGREYVTETRRDEVGARLDGLKWLPVVAGDIFPCSAATGLAVNNLIEQRAISRVRAVAESPFMAPFNVFGVQMELRACVQRVYFVDSGTHLTPLALDTKEVGS